MTHKCISPLDWPVSWTRARSQYTSRFGNGRGVSLIYGLQELLEELRRLGASEVVVTSNVRLRRDGEFDGGAQEPGDHGAAVYFRLKGESRVLACDKWNRVGDNFYAMSKHVDAIRGQVRWGVGSLEQAFGGYRALPAMGAKKPWHVVLALKPSATWKEVVAKREALLKQHHPDKGGDASLAADINSAFDEARIAFKEND